MESKITGKAFSAINLIYGRQYPDMPDISAKERERKWIRCLRQQDQE